MTLNQMVHEVPKWNVTSMNVYVKVAHAKRPESEKIEREIMMKWQVIAITELSDYPGFNTCLYAAWHTPNDLPTVEFHLLVGTKPLLSSSLNTFAVRALHSFCIFSFGIPHIFAIGFKSGDWAGQSCTFRSSDLRYSLTCRGATHPNVIVTSLEKLIMSSNGTVVMLTTFDNMCWRIVVWISPRFTDLLVLHFAGHSTIQNTDVGVSIQSSLREL